MTTFFTWRVSALMAATAVLILSAHDATAFLPTSLTTRSTLVQQSTTTTPLRMLDSASVIMDAMADYPNTLEILASSSSSSMLLSFVDQGQNLAGIFFQASLLPYLLFLYFLSFKANRISPLGNFGFQFVLLFVLSTIPSGIISKSVYGQSLANVDWLHGGAETLLTLANILIVSTCSYVQYGCSLA